MVPHNLAAGLPLPTPSSLLQPLGEALHEFLHHIHHHAVVLLGSHEPLTPCLRDQGEEVFIELYVWIPRRRCSCGAPSDWISDRIIHLLATR